MSKIGELRKQVEAEPESHDVRWQLAKKLYAESSYREALAHLRVLKNDWDRRLNVLRYLAAAYYRLGRYDEAISELTDCIDTWPQEISLREQLAKVYGAAGRNDEARDVWRELLELDPSNRMARKALQRMEENAGKTPYPSSAPHESDDGVDLRPVTICPRCGAQNSAEFERCWQCGSALEGEGTPIPRAKDFDAAIEKPASALMSRLGTLAFVALMAGAIYMTVRHVPPAFSDSPFVETPRTVAEVLLRELAAARLTLWFALGVACPVVIIIAASMLKIRDLAAQHIVGLGVGFATAVYLGSWLPVQILHWIVALTALLLIPAVVAVIGPNLIRSAAVWASLVVTAAGLTAGVFFLYVGLAPFEQAQTIADFAAAHDAKSDPGIHPVESYEAPEEVSLTWGSTGSSWLDSITNEVGMVAQGGAVSPPARFEFYIGRELEGFLELTEPEVRLRMRVQAGTPYRVVFRGPEGNEATLQMTGVLTPLIDRSAP